MLVLVNLPFMTFHWVHQFFAVRHCYLPSIVEKIKQSPIPQLTFQSFYSDLLKDRYSFYTDASKIDDGAYVGFALYFPSAGVSFQYRVSYFASIFTGESLVILRCIEFVLRSRISRSIIFTDFLSVVEALSGAGRGTGSSNSHLILNIRNKLHRASTEGLNVALVWLPAHVGILGNETADLLAKRAIRSEILCPDLPFSNVFSLPLSKLRTDFSRLVVTRSRFVSRRYVENFFDPVSKPWFNYAPWVT